ncbi:MAG: lysophospholipid acyltransferase family protein, partial [Rhodospirillaceae bacterium]|nr:lysophospholipid acyltransferase family protein [Rhodospirillaceae bacterium]
RNDPRVRRLARDSVVEYAIYAAGVLDFYRAPDHEIAESTDLVDEGGRLAKAFAAGKGAIFATGHFGNWDVSGGKIASMTSLWVIQETFNDPRMNEILRRIRESKKMKAVQMDQSMLPLLRGLLRGDSAALLIDRPTPGEGVEVEFFGRSTMVPAGAARLAYRADVPVIVGGARREAGGRHTLFAVGDAYPDRSQPEEAEIQRIASLVFAHFESLIRIAPEQWYMFRPMWADKRVCDGRDW